MDYTVFALLNTSSMNNVCMIRDYYLRSELKYLRKQNVE